MEQGNLQRRRNGVSDYLSTSTATARATPVTDTSCPDTAAPNATRATAFPPTVGCRGTADSAAANPGPSRATRGPYTWDVVARHAHPVRGRPRPSGTGTAGTMGSKQGSKILMIYRRIPSIMKRVSSGTLHNGLGLSDQLSRINTQIHAMAHEEEPPFPKLPSLIHVRSFGLALT